MALIARSAVITEIQAGKHTAMNVKMVNPPRRARRGRVIALHRSGASAGQWRALAEALEGRYDIETPEHYGCESTGMWSAEHAFTVGDEASRTIALIDSSEGKVHLVGHSNGGEPYKNIRFTSFRADGSAQRQTAQ
jgi:pimeloyl-ACP methyl ester carboxylesterase